MRERLQVDPISKIEKDRVCYRDQKGGLQFAKWLTLLICLQMTWTRLKKELKGHKYPFVYLYEERLWQIAATIDEFIPAIINEKVR